MQDFIIAKQSEISELCRAHHVRKLTLFGSAVRDDFDPDKSDIDFLVEFTAEARANYSSNFFSLEEALARLLRRDIDLVVSETLENPYIRRRVHEQQELLYAA